MRHLVFQSRALVMAIALMALLICSRQAIAQDKPNKMDDVTATAGMQVYKQARCYACHGEQGFGGVGPKFRQDSFLAIGDYVIAQILIGRGIMPSFAEALNDEQIASVASYIRESWGNNYGDVKANQVAATRKELNEKMPPRPRVPAAEQNQPRVAPAPPSGGQPPGQPMPPPNMR